jgi:hypothetical protein
VLAALYSQEDSWKSGPQGYNAAERIRPIEKDLMTSSGIETRTFQLVT